MRPAPAEQELHRHLETGEHGGIVVLEAVVDEADYDFAVFQRGVPAEDAHVVGDARFRAGGAQGFGHVFQQVRPDMGGGPCRGPASVRLPCGGGVLSERQLPQRGADADFGQPGDGGELPFVERACGKLEGEQKRSVRDT